MNIEKFNTSIETAAHTAGSAMKDAVQKFGVEVETLLTEASDLPKHLVQASIQNAYKILENEMAEFSK